jgi:hypothetical protein
MLEYFGDKRISERWMPSDNGQAGRSKAALKFVHSALRLLPGMTPKPPGHSTRI